MNTKTASIRKYIVFLYCYFSCFFIAFGASKEKTYELFSPDKNVFVKVFAGEELRWTLHCDGKEILDSSPVSMLLQGGKRLGVNCKIAGVERNTINTSFDAINYRKSTVKDYCNQLILRFNDDYSIEFRAYNDAVAYRFLTDYQSDIVVENESVNFNFTSNHKAFIPYMWDYRGGVKFNHSFEALYRECRIADFSADSLAFLPLLVDLENGLKVVVLEADLEDYPGMYLDVNNSRKGFKGVFAKYPIETKMGGYNGMNEIPVKRADYIARTRGDRSFPWRALAISRHDKELLDNDIVQKLAAPSRISDHSWIKTGLVSWDWWNDWNISGVNFKAGYNTETYKYYIDFAAENKLPYIVMDWGWSSKTNLFEFTEPNVDLKEIIDYGKNRGVDVVLWASWYAVKTQADSAFAHYSAMGAKGFKIDFVDRDDQLAVASLYEIAEKAAKYKLIVDYHGVFKPTGLQRTYPNVIGYEGVKGLENYKWADEDQPRYAVTIPFIRMMAGPMDYTPGAMRNSTEDAFFANNSMPMSKGTRCNQLAMYVMFEAPFQMLSDNPTVYRKEQECTNFIAQMPTTFDETVALDGSVAEYAVVARRKGDVWFVSAMTNWTPRMLEIDLSFLADGQYNAEIFCDGLNADRCPTDYTRVMKTVHGGQKIKIEMAPGGGWVAKFSVLK
jgi:alpha-glucosidase